MDNNNQFDSLNEKTKQINNALKYTKDIDRAKLMIAGQYNDIIITKCKFAIEDSGLYGIILVFFNSPNKYIMNINSIISSNKNFYEKGKVNDNWKTFYLNFRDYIQHSDDNISSYDFTNHLLDSFKGYDVYSEISNNNIEYLTKVFTEIIIKFKKGDNVKCQLDMEISNSLQVEAEDILLELPPDDTGVGDQDEESQIDKRITEIESSADFLVEGRFILSPVKGKRISEVKTSDFLKVLLNDKNDEISHRVANSLNAISEDGDFLPIKARVKDIIPLEKSGYIVYAVIAKNVLIKIVEEENIKVEMDSPIVNINVDNGQGKLLLYIALLFGLLIVTLVIIFKLI